MTAWKDRALEAERKLADCQRELETFYCSRVPVNEACEALRRMTRILGCEVQKATGVPEKMTREVEYVELGGKRDD